MYLYFLDYIIIRLHNWAINGESGKNNNLNELAH